MFCPKCRSEYIEGITRCPDCDVDMVQELPEDNDGFRSISGFPDSYPETEWVMIYKPNSAQQVAMIKMILEREQIPSYIANEFSRRAALYSPHNLAFELWVRLKEAERAIKILQDELDLR